MATGTNRKRPWEEEENGFSGLAARAAPDPQCRTKPFPMQTTSGQDYDNELMAAEGMSSISQSRRTSLPYSSPIRPSNPPSRDEIEDEQRGTRQLSPPKLFKRQRVVYTEDDPVTMNLPGPMPVSGALPLRFDDFQGNQSDQMKRRERESSLQPNMARDNPQPPSGSNSLDIGVQSTMRGAALHTTQKSCQTCSSLRGVVLRVMKAVENLHGDLLGARMSERPGQHEVINSYLSGMSRPPPDSRLDQSLEWVFDRVNGSVQMVRDTWATRTTIPPNIPEAMIYGERLRDRSGHDERSREGKLEMRSMKPFAQQADNSPRRVNIPRALPLWEDQRRRSIAGESGPSHLPYSPLTNTSSMTSLPMLPQSPMQAPQSNRPLPSPSSLNFSSSQFLPPLSPSLTTSKSPHTAHLQELQHQLSTKSLAHQILQGEHDKLLAAYSRSQTRCATLDRKSQVSDTEINNLVEDRVRLQAQVDALEVQVDELQRSRDEAHKQSVANGAQYMQIMGMSSRLQAQGAADLKKWKSDKDDWETEKEALLSKIEGLENSGATTPKILPTSDSESAPGEQHPPARLVTDTVKAGIKSGDELVSESVETLHKEISRLRKNCLEVEMSLQAHRDDSMQIDEILGKLGTIGDRMRRRTKPKLGSTLLIETTTE